MRRTCLAKVLKLLLCLLNRRKKKSTKFKYVILDDIVKFSHVAFPNIFFYPELGSVKVVDS